MSRHIPGIPGARNIHHIAYTVPNLDQAIDFFIHVIGAELLYRIGSVEDVLRDVLVHPIGRISIAEHGIEVDCVEIDDFVGVSGI